MIPPGFSQQPALTPGSWLGVCCSGNREGGQTELDSGTQEGDLPAPHGEALAHPVR